MEVVKLKPAIKDYIWAGTNLKRYGKETSFEKIAECWELSFHKDGPCLIDSGLDKGKLLMDVASKADIGTYVSTFPFFPVLIKLIDSGDNLSVQVHPSDDYALKNENSYGKTEMWYVLAREEGAGLYVGLKEDSSKDEIEKSLKDGTILNKLNFFPVEKGECYFIKSGTIHAIGKGVTLIEIQQNSNLTYRLYDYNRVDANGNHRPLHIEKALRVIDYKKYTPIKFKGNMIGKSKYFSSYVYGVEEKDEIIAPSSSFVSVTFIQGEGEINSIPYKTYDTFFIPANKKAAIKGSGKYVLTTVEKEQIYMPDGTYYLGIDGGGSKTIFAVADSKLDVIYKKELGPTSLDTFPFSQTKKVLEEGLNDIKVPICSAFMGVGGGVKGYNDKKVSDIVRKSLINHPSLVETDSDVINALYAGLEGKDGMVVIDGTGSVCYGKNKGETYRSGGYSYKEGDLGSGYDLGRKALQHLGKVIDGREEETNLSKAVGQYLNCSTYLDLYKFYLTSTRTSIASLAKIVVNSNCEKARLIMEEGADGLKEMIKSVYVHLGFNYECSISIVGSLGKALTPYRDLIQKKIKELSSDIVYVESLNEPYYGSLLKAKENYLNGLKEIKKNA